MFQNQLRNIEIVRAQRTQYSVFCLRETISSYTETVLVIMNEATFLFMPLAVLLLLPNSFSHDRIETCQ